MLGKRITCSKSEIISLVWTLLSVNVLILGSNDLPPPPPPPNSLSSRQKDCSWIEATNPKVYKNNLVRWTKGSMFLHLVVWTTSGSRKRLQTFPELRAQTSALPWSDHTTLAAINYRLWFPTQKSGVLPKVAQNTFLSIWCIWKHAGQGAYSPAVCACPSPQKGVV